jgi:hypothetical protein
VVGGQTLSKGLPTDPRAQPAGGRDIGPPRLLCVCVFITAGPITKLFTGDEIELGLQRGEHQWLALAEKNCGITDQDDTLRAMLTSSPNCDSPHTL